MIVNRDLALRRVKRRFATQERDDIYETGYHDYTIGDIYCNA